MVPTQQPVADHARRQTQQQIEIEIRPEQATELVVFLTHQLVGVHCLAACWSSEQIQRGNHQPTGREFDPSLYHQQPVSTADPCSGIQHLRFLANQKRQPMSLPT